MPAIVDGPTAISSFWQRGIFTFLHPTTIPSSLSPNIRFSWTFQDTNAIHPLPHCTVAGLLFFMFYLLSVLVVQCPLHDLMKCGIDLIYNVCLVCTLEDLLVTSEPRRLQSLPNIRVHELIFLNLGTLVPKPILILAPAFP